MSTLENLIIDIFDDVNLRTTLEKVASNLPPRLRSAQLPTIEDRDKLEDDRFALSMITKHASKVNKFPVDSPINTALSNEYFNINHHKLPSEAQKTAATYIKMACDKFGIAPSLSVKTASLEYPTVTNIYIEKQNDTPGGAVVSKQAEIEDSEFYYALTKEADGGVVSRKYAMPSPEHITKATEYFDKYASHFSPEDRHQFAHNVVNRAIELGVSVESKEIEKYAGTEYGSSLNGHLSIRKKLLDGQPLYLDALEKLASYQETTGPSTFAKVLHELDKKAGLDKYYDKYLADPYAATFKGQEKTAGYVYEADGIYLTGEEIEKAANDKYSTLKNYFGPTLADGLKKEGASAFDALPQDAKDIVARIANGEIQ